MKSWRNTFAAKYNKLQEKKEKWHFEQEYHQEKRRLIKEKCNFFIPKISTTKLIVLFLFLNCTAVELFTGYVIIKNIELAAMLGMGLELSPLVTLIGAVVGEVIGFAIYAVKAAKENTVGGITYTLATQENDIKEEIL